MNDCDRYQEMICCLIDGELTRDERNALMAHIALCPECKATYEAFSAVSVAVASDLEEVPESLHENIMSGVRRRALFNKNKRSASRRVKGLIAAAACFAVVLISAVGIFDTLLARDASVAEDASPAAQSFDELGNHRAPALIPPSPSTSPSASVSVPLPSASPTAAPSAPVEADPYGGSAPAVTDRPAQTRAPVQTQTPVQTPAPLQSLEPVLPPTQAYTADADPSVGGTSAPQPERADDPALSTEPTVSDPDQGTLAAQSAQPFTENGGTAPAVSAAPAATLTPIPCPPKRAVKSGAAPTGDLPSAVDAQGIETDPSVAESNVLMNAPAVSEEDGNSFADKILRSFKSMFGISEPTATRAPEKLSEDDVDVIVDLADMKDYKPFSDLLLGELSELPEGNADRVYLFLMKNGDMEIKLLAYAYGDEIYYTIHDELVQQNIYLADCTQDELEKFILPYLPEETAKAANDTGVVAPAPSAASTQTPVASNIIPTESGLS